MTAVCGAPKAGGERCTCAVGLCPTCGMCFAHCEHRAAARAAARSKGGRTTGIVKQARRQGAKAVQYRTPAAEEVPPPPETADDARKYLAWILDAAARGELGGSLARDLSTVADRFVKAVGASDHEARLARLEAMGAKRKAER